MKIIISKLLNNPIINPEIKIGFISGIDHSEPIIIINIVSIRTIPPVIDHNIFVFYVLRAQNVGKPTLGAILIVAHEIITEMVILAKEVTSLSKKN